MIGVLGLVAPAEAHAYLDPGTGSMVLQAIIAGLLGIVFTCKSYLRAALGTIGTLWKKPRVESDT